MYFCLDGTNNNTIHICGPTTRCKKRHQDIFTYDIQKHEEHLNVHSIECAVGYFQPAHFQKSNWNCFTKCEKDESVVIIQNATNDRPALARCNSHKNYCNGYNISLFELGYSEDYCLLAMRDLKIKCDKEEELLPNCKCAIKCHSDTIRDWNNSLMCVSKNTTLSTSHVPVVETTALSDQNTRVPSQEGEDGAQDNEKVKKNQHIETEDSKTSKEDKEKENEEDTERIYTLVELSVESTILIVGVCVVIILAITKGYRIMQNRRPLQRIHQSRVDNREKHHYKADTINVHYGANDHLIGNSEQDEKIEEAEP
ncbi:uncharacterized protein LOC132720277 [Ruditapes philippinarum]|uniref:uncharacterized protein LOC132720277 n=1 Tax=Ruditapes philippinarum TaxID=129788 RepID=UPI00295BAACE|nr:uncharacterized protein LOC132720277 [Ruditapes philippinarum]